MIAINQERTLIDNEAVLKITASFSNSGTIYLCHDETETGFPIGAGDNVTAEGPVYLYADADNQQVEVTTI